MALPQQEFDEGCRKFTDACIEACNWKLYYGAAYTTRLSAAIKYLKEAIVDAERLIERDRMDKLPPYLD